MYYNKIYSEGGGDDNNKKKEKEIHRKGCLKKKTTVVATSRVHLSPTGLLRGKARFHGRFRPRLSRKSLPYKRVVEDDDQIQSDIPFQAENDDELTFFRKRHYGDHRKPSTRSGQAEKFKVAKMLASSH